MTSIDGSCRLFFDDRMVGVALSPLSLSMGWMSNHAMSSAERRNLELNQVLGKGYAFILPHFQFPHSSSDTKHFTIPGL